MNLVMFQFGCNHFGRVSVQPRVHVVWFGLGRPAVPASIDRPANYGRLALAMAILLALSSWPWGMPWRAVPTTRQPSMALHTSAVSRSIGLRPVTVCEA